MMRRRIDPFVSAILFLALTTLSTLAVGCFAVADGLCRGPGFAEDVLPRRCGHSHVIGNLTTFDRQHYEHVGATKFMRKRFRRKARVDNHDPDHRGMRIHVDYQLDDTERAIQDFLMRELVPAAVSVIESTIQARHGFAVANYELQSSFPENCLEMQPSRLLDDPDWAVCGHAHVKDAFYESYETCRPLVPGYPAEGFECETHTTPGVPNADLVLYVTAVESPYCDFAAAYAQYCSLDLDTNRPLAGAINFCPSSLSTSPDRFHHSVEVAVHELLHTLVFSETLFEKFVDDEGNPIPLNQVVKSSSVGGRAVKRIITPKVQEAARNHFGCSVLEGADLEDEGGIGTAGSHWETRTLQGELMDGMSGVNIASDRHALSPFTLALLEDSGWYTVNWNNAVRPTNLKFSLDKELLLGEYIDNNPDQHWFCKTAGNEECTSDLHAYGRCQSDLLLNGCLVITPFSNVDCKTPEHAENSLVDWGARYGAKSFCLAVEQPMVQRESINGRTYETTQGPRTGDCYSIKCSKDGSYSVEMLNRKIQCAFDGKTISLRNEFSQFVSGGVDCPAGDRVCSRLGCPNECSGHGWCHDEQCYCQLGYTGTNCSLRICNAESTYCICRLYEGHSYGTCAPGTEDMSHIIQISEVGSDAFQVLKIAFDVVEISEETLDASVPQALSDVLEGVEVDDVQILEINPGTSDDHHSLRLLSAHSTVIVGITTSDAVELSLALTNAVLSGDFAEALTHAGLQYVDGSLNILDAETVRGGEKKDSVAVAHIVMFVMSGVGFLVLAIIVICRYRSLQRRHPPTPSPYMSNPWVDQQTGHPLSAHYGAYPRPNPFL